MGRDGEIYGAGRINSTNQMSVFTISRGQDPCQQRRSLYICPFEIQNIERSVLKEQQSETPQYTPARVIRKTFANGGACIDP